MKRTQVTDCRTLPFDLASVHAALVDFDNYPQVVSAPELRTSECCKRPRCLSVHVSRFAHEEDRSFAKWPR